MAEMFCSLFENCSMQSPFGCHDVSHTIHITGMVKHPYECGRVAPAKPFTSVGKTYCHLQCNVQWKTYIAHWRHNPIREGTPFVTVLVLWIYEHSDLFRVCGFANGTMPEERRTIKWKRKEKTKKKWWGKVGCRKCWCVCVCTNAGCWSGGASHIGVSIKFIGDALYLMGCTQ